MADQFLIFISSTVHNIIHIRIVYTVNFQGKIISLLLQISCSLKFQLYMQKTVCSIFINNNYEDGHPRKSICERDPSLKILYLENFPIYASPKPETSNGGFFWTKCGPSWQNSGPFLQNCGPFKQNRGYF